MTLAVTQPLSIISVKVHFSPLKRNDKKKVRGEEIQLTTAHSFYLFLTVGKKVGRGGGKEKTRKKCKETKKKMEKMGGEWEERKLYQCLQL